MSNSNLKSKTIVGMLWSTVQKFGLTIINFVSNLILVHLLSPDDFGCIGMLTIFIAVSNIFIDGGFAAALIQKRNPTQEDYSTAFFYNLCLSISLYVTFFCAAPFIASFYGIPVLKDLLRIQSLLLIINALGIVQRTRLRKFMQFKKLTSIYLVSAIISSIIVVICAYKGLGVWSIVVYQIVLSLTQTMLLWREHKWFPTCIFNFKSFISLFKYGSFLLLTGLLDTIYVNIQGLIIGKRFTPAVMGYYSQAQKLADIPSSLLSGIVVQVTFPVFSMIKDDASSLLAAHRKCIQSTNFITMPLLGLLIVIAHPLILFLYSDKWLNSIPYFQILCVAGFANCLQSVNYQLYIAAGHSRSMFKWTILKNIIGIVLIIIGSIWGVYGILWGMVIGIWCSYIINAILAGHITGYSFMLQLYELFPVVLITIFSCIISLLIGEIINIHYIIDMFIQFILFLISYILGVKLLQIPAYYTYRDIFQNMVTKLTLKLRN